ncbi:MAG: DAPG hydrolase family protein [Solirubrobacteraceae bacterium]
MPNAYDGTTLARGEDGYEQARRAAAWNARTPPRHPERIVLAESESDIVKAVREALEHDMKVGVRRRALPKRLPQALATHCAEEYANLGALLPELFGRFGPKLRV